MRYQGKRLVVEVSKRDLGVRQFSHNLDCPADWRTLGFAFINWYGPGVYIWLSVGPAR